MTDFKTAKQLQVEESQLLAAAPVEERHELAPSEYIVAPVMTLEQAKIVWNEYLQLKGFLLNDPACFDVIEGSKEMNRTGATRLATAFGLSTELIRVDEGRVELVDEGKFDYRYRVIVRVSKGSRHSDGIGSCRVSEIPGKMDDSKREHFATTKAWTRAAKRAIADILGGTEAE
jgi:hypothetical protein